MKRFLGEKLFLCALFLAATSAVAFLASAVRAVRIEPMIAVMPPLSRPGTNSSAASLAPPPSNVLAAVAHDAFLPERIPMPTRYLPRAPGSADSAEALTTARPPQGELVLIGVALLPEGRAVALCRWGTEPARLVRLGERIGDFRLSRVESGRAVFRAGDGRSFELAVRKAGS